MEFKANVKNLTVAPATDVPGLTMQVPDLGVSVYTSNGIEVKDKTGAVTFSVRATGGLTANDVAANSVSTNNLYDRASNIAWAGVDAVNAIAQLPLPLDLSELAAPATPATGKVRVYAGTDHKLHVKDSTGTDTALGAGGGGATISRTAVGSEPASPATGDVDLYSDGAVLARYGGTTWNTTYGPVWPLTRPRLADWTAINQSTATIAEKGGGIGITTAGTAGDDWRLLVKSTPATPYTLTVAWLATAALTGNPVAGLVLRESSSGKFVTLRYIYNNVLVVSDYTNATTFSTNPSGTLSTALLPPAPFIWLQVADNGTNRTWRYSCDGLQFLDFYTEARTAFCTADQWGFGFNRGVSGTSLAAALWLHAGVS